MNFFIHRIFHASFAILAVSSITEYTFADKSDTDSPKSIPIELSSKNIVGPLISEALENNPGLRAFDLRYQAARESITSARALPNPKVQLTHFVESIQTRKPSETTGSRASSSRISLARLCLPAVHSFRQHCRKNTRSRLPRQIYQSARIQHATTGSIGNDRRRTYPLWRQSQRSPSPPN
jgi:hypothetical protein